MPDNPTQAPQQVSELNAVKWENASLKLANLQQQINSIQTEARAQAAIRIGIEADMRKEANVPDNYIYNHDLKTFVPPSLNPSSSSNPMMNRGRGTPPINLASRGVNQNKK